MWHYCYNSYRTLFLVFFGFEFTPFSSFPLIFEGHRVLQDCKTFPESKSVRSFVLTFFICKVLNLMLARTLTERVVYPGTRPNPDPHPPRGCPFNSLGPVWANMYSDPFPSTTPAAAVDNPGCVKWRETLSSQNGSAGRDIPMGQLVTKVLVPRESPLPPYQLWPGHNSPVPRRWEPGLDRCPPSEKYTRYIVVSSWSL